MIIWIIMIINKNSYLIVNKILTTNCWAIILKHIISLKKNSQIKLKKTNNSYNKIQKSWKIIRNYNNKRIKVRTLNNICYKALQINNKQIILKIKIK